jgi:S-adenosylmethionine decarboxylase
LNNGKHLILDIHGCDPEILNDYDRLECIMYEALHLIGAKLLRLIGEKFDPQGVTLLALLAESHCSIHTWPEHNFAAIDLYTCGNDFDPVAIKNMFKQKLNSTTDEEKDMGLFIERPFEISGLL